MNGRRTVYSRDRCWWWSTPVLASVALFFAAAAPALAADAELASRVIILANSDDADSLRVARHYAEARHVPLENIIAQKMSRDETISWREFVTTIWDPLRDELVARKWIDAIPIAITDRVGRKKYAIDGHRIAALVICRGAPLKITHEPEFYTEHEPFTKSQEFRSNAGAVDSELSLLAAGSYNINAFVPNPLFRKDSPNATERGQVILVGRLDGPTVDHALALVDRAVAAERTGLIGRAYVDIGGIYQQGDQWLDAVVVQLGVLGFDTSVDREGSTLPDTARVDEPVLYFGWYTSDLNGPFALPGFQFPLGAVALHIHSFSAGTLRSERTGWTAPLVARGITATVGNVHEPYLQLTHRPDLLLRALARGMSLGEAASYSLPAFSWQTMLIGDPLYRPFAISFEEQWKNRANLSPRLAGYLALRAMRLLENSSKRAEALALGRAAHEQTPSLALAVGLAQRIQAAGDATGAAQVLEFAVSMRNFRTDDWALVREAAQLLTVSGQPGSAVALYQSLFANKLSPGLRLAWLTEAADAAELAQNSSQADAWKKEYTELGGRGTPSKK